MGGQLYWVVINNSQRFLCETDKCYICDIFKNFFMCIQTSAFDNRLVLKFKISLYPFMLCIGEYA
jgi:hypothetical protein